MRRAATGFGHGAVPIWRIETYSGMRAESLTAASVFGFLWSMRGELLQFLRWTGAIQSEARKRA